MAAVEHVWRHDLVERRVAAVLLIALLIGAAVVLASAALISAPGNDELLLAPFRWSPAKVAA